MLIVAEISCNHNGSLRRAIETIHRVKDCHVKFQTWSPDTIAVPYTIKDGLWAGMELTDLYKEAHTCWEWHEQLFEETRRAGNIPFSTPFDKESVDFLETLDCPIYKIASFELVDLQLIDYVAQTMKPIIMSTGMAEFKEIECAVNTVKRYHNDITLLHCVSEYPTTLENANLRTMKELEKFGCKVGISDHSHGVTVPMAATAMGAEVIEKHVTLTKEGLDKDFSMLTAEFNSMVRLCRDVKTALGEVKFGGDKTLRRSLYYAKDLKKGQILKEEHIKTARPNLGLNPMRINEVIGQPLTKSVKKDEPVQA